MTMVSFKNRNHRHIEAAMGATKQFFIGLEAVFFDRKLLQARSESIVQWLYSSFFWIMIEDLIKLQKKKVQINKKENIKVQQRE